MLLSLVAKQTEKCKDCLAFAVENGYIDLEYKAEKVSLVQHRFNLGYKIDLTKLQQVFYFSHQVRFQLS